MNSAKRVLELIAAVFSIVLGAFLTVGSVIILAGLEILDEAGQIDHVDNKIAQLSTIIALLVSIALIIIASLLAQSPIKRGKVGHSFGLKLALAILAGVVCFLEFVGSAIFWGFIFLVPLVLIVVSMCLRE